MQCPICKKDVPEPADTGERTFYPFCSERCKLIDLGRWLGGRYQIPVTPPSDDDTDTPPTPSTPPRDLP